MHFPLWFLQNHVFLNLPFNLLKPLEQAIKLLEQAIKPLEQAIKRLSY